MNGKTYKKFVKPVNDRSYDILKLKLTADITDFLTTDNLMELVRAMRIGTKILKKEKFPIQEFIMYEK